MSRLAGIGPKRVHPLIGGRVVPCTVDKRDSDKTDDFLRPTRLLCWLIGWPLDLARIQVIIAGDDANLRLVFAELGFLADLLGD